MDLGDTRGRGTPVLNVQAGVVERVIRDNDTARAFSGYGNGVVVNHGDGTWALYAHMDQARAAQGQRVEPGVTLGVMGNTSNGKFAGMPVHLHVELRRAKRDGTSPFPGPYRTYNLDPRPWLEQKGLRFAHRGGFEIQPGSEMDTTRSIWSQLGGVDHYPEVIVRGYHLPESVLGTDDEYDNEYEPVGFDRDVRFGLTPMEWAVVGTSALVVTGGAAAIALRRGMRANRRRSRRRRAA